MTDASFHFDEDAIVAGIELVQRSGAQRVEVGHLEDEVPMHLARWWAKAQYRGAVIAVDEHAGPVEAVEALARRILKGAKCVGCGRTVSISGSAELQRLRCRWTREGRHWMPACTSGRQRLADRIAQQGSPT